MLYTFFCFVLEVDITFIDKVKNFFQDYFPNHPKLAAVGTILVIIAVVLYVVLKELPALSDGLKLVKEFLFGKRKDEVIIKGKTPLIDLESIIPITNPENDYVREENNSDIDALAVLISNKDVTSAKEKKKRQIIVVAGPPGIGKTRLVQEVCRKNLREEFKVQIYIDFEAVNSPTTRSKFSEEKIYESALTQVKSALGGGGVDSNDFRAIAKDFQKPTIFFIDNYEQILDNEVLHQRIWNHIIIPIAESNDLIKIIITSREKINSTRLFQVSRLTNAKKEDVDTMDVNQLVTRHTALKLFCKIHNQILEQENRLKEDKYDFTKEEFKIMIDLCDKVSCLPLGIHLMASRSTDIPLAEILDKLNFYIQQPVPKSFKEYGNRHLDLYSAFKWSFDALTDEEKSFYKHLTYFQNGFYKNHLPVWPQFKSKAETDMVVAKLYQKSFLRKQQIELVSKRDRMEYDRYEAYVLFKELLQLEVSNFEEKLDQDYLNEIHLKSNKFLTDMTNNVFGKGEILNLGYIKKALRLEYENIVYNIDNCSKSNKSLAVDTLVKLESLLNEIGPYLKLESLFDALIEKIDNGEQRAQLLMGRARVYKSSDHRELGKEPIREAIKIMESQNEINEILGQAYRIGAYLGNELADDELRESVFEKVNSLSESDQLKIGQLNLAFILSDKAKALEKLGKIGDAITQLEQVLKLMEGYDIQQAKIYNTLGMLYWRYGYPDESINCYHHAIEKYNGIGEDRWILGFNTNLGLVYCDKGDLDFSHEITDTAYKTLKHQGPRGWLQINLLNSGRILARRFPKSETYFSESKTKLLESFENLKTLKYWESYILNALELAELYYKYDKLKEALDYTEIAMKKANEEGYTKWMRYFRSLCLAGLIEYHYNEDSQKSLKLLKEAEALLKEDKNNKWETYEITSLRYSQLKKLHI
ncbi:MAG: hypothetical protein CMC68_03365 [Flavobacteriaceae bacterium]|nr:hypothetical protein [Flavobacteriaceae bacterium]|tara:strand:+ start:13008 stop:15794 length:2787 start_codon:yes stop_codon:yes gene_type:complete